MKRAPEVAIAAPVVADFRARGWTCFAEVETDRGRCDIVARHHEDTRAVDILLALEVKAAIGWDVISQAARWRDAAHYVAVVTPPRQRASAAHDLYAEAITKFGMGWISVDAHNSVREEIKAPPLRLTGPAWLADFLRDEQQHFALAGNATGSRFSPHAMTVRQVIEFVRDNPRCTGEDIFLAGVTHWRSEVEATRELVKLAKRGELGPVVKKHDGCRPRFLIFDDAEAMPLRAGAQR